MKSNPYKKEEITGVIRNTSLQILRQYFDTHRLFAGQDFEKNAKKVLAKFVDGLVAEIEKIVPETLQEQVKQDLHRIYSMKNGKTFLALIRDVKYEGGDIVKIFADAIRPYDKAFILFLKYPEAFNHNYITYVDGKNHKKMWAMRNDSYIKKDKVLSDVMIDKLRDEASKYLSGEGRVGKVITARKTSEFKEEIVIHYNDFPEEKPDLDGDKVDTKFVPKANKIIIVYDKKRRFVKTYSEDAGIRSAMHRVFAKVVFDQDNIPHKQPDNKVCNLNFALDQIINKDSIPFKISKEFCISKILPVSIQLQKKNTNHSLYISANRMGDKYDDLYEAIKNYFTTDHSSDKAKLKETEILALELAFLHSDPRSRKELITKRTTLTSKNTVTDIGEDDVHFEMVECLRDSMLLQID